MRIVIDLQAVQTGSFQNEISSFSLSLSKAIIAHRKDHEIILVLNGCFPASIHRIRTEFDAILPQQQIRVWQTPYNENNKDKTQQKIAEKLREAFLLSLHPDILHISHLFEGLKDHAVSSIGIHEPNILTSVMLFPSNLYNFQPSEELWYHQKFDHLRRADLCIAYNDTAKQEYTHHLDLPFDAIMGLSNAQAPCLASSAKRLISTFETLFEKNQTQTPKLAYISPLPPAKSGIADYSAELLPELSRYYKIDVIVEQKQVEDNWIKANCNIYDPEWFRQNNHLYDRVLYHMGNSFFHTYMIELFETCPGILVLHDFFIGDLMAYLDSRHIIPNIWSKALYHSHGYKALSQRFSIQDDEKMVGKYPCNLNMFEQMKGVIVHSDYAKQLAEKFYTKDITRNWTKILQLYKPNLTLLDKITIREKLGFQKEDFLVCSFGIIGYNKLNDRALHAWLSSELSQKSHCHFIFVGECPENEYGLSILKLISDHPAGKRIRITGYASSEEFKHYLSIADIAIQLRTTRGETSRAVLDCLDAGIPTIVNKNGSMAEFPQDCLYFIEDTFEIDALKDAIEFLWKDKNYRETLSERTKEYVQRAHSPRNIAQQFYETIESYYRGASFAKNRLLKSLVSHPGLSPSKENILSLVQSISSNHPDEKLYNLYVDVSALVMEDLKTGIQRVVRGILKELLEHPPKGYKVEPVYAAEHLYRYARHFTLEFLNCPTNVLEKDTLIQPKAGDIFFAADFHATVVTRHAQYHLELRKMGVRTFFVVYDLLPISHPQYFPNAKEYFSEWLMTISNSDGAICISRSTADCLAEWMKTHKPSFQQPFKIGYVHIGTDLKVISSIKKDTSLLQQLSQHPTILMVGTVEPRKGHHQTLKAFELLWKKNLGVNLVIVGKQGWMVEELIEVLENHTEKNKQLHWLKWIEDETLVDLYAAADGILIASEAEGFGLPLIEAAQHKRPILARDIPIFREVAGEHVTYFPNHKSPKTLAHSLEHWLNALKTGQAPQSDHMPYLSWEESAKEYLSTIFNKESPNWLYQFSPIESSKNNDI